MIWYCRLNYGKYQIVTPGKVSLKKVVPEHIPKPSYAVTGIPTDIIPDLPEIKHHEQIERMRESCTLAANILKTVESWLQVM